MASESDFVQFLSAEDNTPLDFDAATRAGSMVLNSNTGHFSMDSTCLAQALPGATSTGPSRTTSPHRATDCLDAKASRPLNNTGTFKSLAVLPNPFSITLWTYPTLMWFSPLPPPYGLSILFSTHLVALFNPRLAGSLLRTHFF